MTLTKFISNASRRGVPLLALTTNDPHGAVRQMVQANGVPIHLAWCCNDGFVGMNQASVPIAKEMVAPVDAPPGFEMLSQGDPTTGEEPNWQAFFRILREKLPMESRVYLHNGNRWLTKASFIAGVQKFRDHAQSRKQQLVMIGPDFELPPDLAPDVVVFDDPLPDADALTEKVQSVFAAVKQEPVESVIHQCIDYCRGMSLFQAVQNMALSITRDGMDFKALAQRLAATIKNVRGLELYLPSLTFADVGGLSEVKKFFTRVFTHNDDVDLVLWIDEIEKSGLAHADDTSGVSADQLGQVLQFAADNKCIGVSLVGTPGTGKSEICKALAGEFGVKVLRADLGATMSKYVGESQGYLRAMLRTAKAMGKRIMIVVTANDVQRLDDALVSRIAFSFFFDLLEQEYLYPIWEIQIKRYGVETQQFPVCQGWSGRDIMNCCDAAAMMGIELDEAAKLIVPESVRSSRKIEQRRQLADGRLLDASRPGFYRKDRVPTQERSITV
jgi:hypothetical protein